MELIYIGSDFYFRSGTRMSSLYNTAGNRQDWGSIETALRLGNSVHIRPATEEEIKPYIEQLKKYEDSIKTERKQDEKK